MDCDDFNLRILSDGVWIELNVAPYQVAGDALASRSVQQRRIEAKNPFLEGTYTVSALRENVMETISVYVRGANAFEVHQGVRRLCEALDQRKFRMQLEFDGAVHQWSCMAADYQVESQREFIHARMAKVVAQVPRHPVEEVREVRDPHTSGYIDAYGEEG